MPHGSPRRVHFGGASSGCIQCARQRLPFALELDRIRPCFDSRTPRCVSQELTPYFNSLPQSGGCTAESSVPSYQAVTTQAVGPLRYLSASNSENLSGLIAYIHVPYGVMVLGNSNAVH
jgi:hypothetical protein